MWLSSLFPLRTTESFSTFFNLFQPIIKLILYNRIVAMQIRPNARRMRVLEIIWGLKTHALFDIWSIEHILSGFSVGWFVYEYNRKKAKELLGGINTEISPERIKKLRIKYDLFLILFFAYIWETLEHYLEEGLAGTTVQYWFQGVEFWGNRLITDPLMMILGYMIARSFPKTVWPARCLSLLWLVVHIFIFPHSMYLQTLLWPNS